MKCEGCGETVNGVRDACVLEALVGVAVQRGNLSQRQALKLLEDVDIDRLWRDVGKIVDGLEDGVYNQPDDE